MDQTVLEIKMTPDGVNAVLNAIGKLPTDSGMYPLFMDIRTQATAQLKKLEDAKQPAE